MDSDRRPSLGDRAMSTPLAISTLSTMSKNGRVVSPFTLSLNMLTPPASPRHSRSSSNLSSMTDESLPEGLVAYQQRRKDSESERLTPTALLSHRTTDGILICPFDVEILKDQRNNSQTFGYGAWSTVFRATGHQRPTSGLATPPLSPAARPPLLVAVKQPARKDAKLILENEGRLLSYLMSVSGNDRYVVPFHGILQSSASLVLTAIPYSLDEHIKKSAAQARASRTTWNMSEPVIGSTTIWLNFAQTLISALTWLHDQAMVVHGDIKPGNILLNRRTSSEEMEGVDNQEQFPYEPLLIDFSSSQRLNADLTPNTLSAVTREYTAPELLSSKVLLDPNSAATPASDVFSLAVTLLVAATGNTMVYTGSVFQRQAMATQGWMVIQAVRNGPMEEGARVPRKGVVERALEKATLREGTGRIDAASWKSKVEEIINGEPSI